MFTNNTQNILSVSIAALLATTAISGAQFTTPNIITTAGDTQAILGGTLFINHGLQGVGRISASTLDSFGETFGSVSSLQITNWVPNGGSYSGTFNILPDRGYNNNNAGGFFSAYAARIQQVDFSFTPYTGNANIGGVDIVSRIAAQNQITFTSAISGVKLTYLDPTTNASSVTTGLDPATGTVAGLFGGTMPYVVNYTGQAIPGGPNVAFTGINKLALDSEALVLKGDGSGYIGDEYGTNIYYFNTSKEIVGAIVPPAAIQPHSPVGTLNFVSTAAPLNGRRNNQGMEGIALSPDGTKLFGLLQSATIQDSNNTNAQTRLNTRLVIYDVSASTTPGAPVAEYVLQLPTYTGNGGGGAVNATAAQSELVAIDDHRILVLSRDGNGAGATAANKSTYKSILLVDTSLNAPTNIAGTARDAEGGTVTTAPGVLDPLITPLSWTEAINLLNSTQLAKFNINLDGGGAVQVTEETLSEKWEGMSLVSAHDPFNPNDYFLFVANDNDFLTSQGKMIGPDGTLVDYNAFSAHTPVRTPGLVGSSTANENDTMFLAYRVTIAPVPEPNSALLAACGALGLLSSRRNRSR